MEIEIRRYWWIDTLHLKVREFFLPKVDTQIHWFLLSHNESFSSVLNVLILDPLVSIVTNAQQGRRISVWLEKKMQEQGKSRLAVMGRGVWRKTGCFSKITRNDVTPLERRVL